MSTFLFAWIYCLTIWEENAGQYIMIYTAPVTNNCLDTHVRGERQPLYFCFVCRLFRVLDAPRISVYFLPFYLGSLGLD